VGQDGTGHGGRDQGFKPPTTEELDLLGAKIGLPETEVRKFQHHYESNGWKVGKNRMKKVSNAMAGWKLRWQEGNYGNAGKNLKANSRNVGTYNEGHESDYANAVVRTPKDTQRNLPGV
jgi:hypothetical protein